MSFRWYYVDDSGSPQSGWIVYGFVEVGAEDWCASLQYWLEFRNYLLNSYGIDAHTELHAYQFINGRGNPSHDAAWNRRKAFRHQVAVEALQAVARLPGVRVGAVVMDGNGTDVRYKKVHRQLKYDERRIIEDPAHQQAHQTPGSAPGRRPVPGQNESRGSPQEILATPARRI